jgi:hypothetical protein
MSVVHIYNKNEFKMGQVVLRTAHTGWWCRDIDFTAIAADKCNNDKIRSKIKLCQHGLIKILMLSIKGSDLIHM